MLNEDPSKKMILDILHLEWETNIIRICAADTLSAVTMVSNDFGL